MRWQLRQPLSWKRRAPSATGPLVAPTTSGVRGWAAKLGDHDDLAPTTHSDPIMTTAAITRPTDQGLRLGARSPLLDRKGAEMRRPPMRSGASKMTYDSRLGGISA